MYSVCCLVTARRLTATIALQSHWRAHLARTHLHMLRIAKHQQQQQRRVCAVTCIQAYVRMRQTQRVLVHMRHMHHTRRAHAATRIQTCVRAWMARRVMRQKKESEAGMRNTTHTCSAHTHTACLHITCIQRMLLMLCLCLCVVCLVRLYLLRTAAVITLQSHWRARVARVHVCMLRTHTHAACVIQHAWRVYVERKEKAAEEAGMWIPCRASHHIISCHAKKATIAWADDMMLTACVFVHSSSTSSSPRMYHIAITHTTHARNTSCHAHATTTTTATTTCCMSHTSICTWMDDTCTCDADQTGAIWYDKCTGCMCMPSCCVALSLILICVCVCSLSTSPTSPSHRRISHPTRHPHPSHTQTRITFGNTTHTCRTHTPMSLSCTCRPSHSTHTSSHHHMDTASLAWIPCAYTHHTRDACDTCATGTCT